MPCARLTRIFLASPVRPVRGVQNRILPFEQTQRDVRTLQLGPSGALDLHTVSGDITIAAGHAPNVTVEILRRARGRTEADAKSALSRVTVQVDARSGHATVATSPDVRPVGAR